MLANLLVALVAVLHLGFLVLEMFLWTTPFGLKTFGLTREFAEQSRALAANQGLYNGFLAAGLIWGLLSQQNGVCHSGLLSLLRDHCRCVRRGDRQDDDIVHPGLARRAGIGAGAGVALGVGGRELARQASALVGDRALRSVCYTDKSV